MNASLPPAVIVEEFTAIARNTLRGFARIRMPSGLIFHDVAIHQKGDSAWAAPASKVQVTRDGNTIRSGDGKLAYSPVVTFASRDLRDRFSKAVVDAMRRAHPEAFDVQ